jgi:hypothetical protein
MANCLPISRLQHLTWLHEWVFCPIIEGREEWQQMQSAKLFSPAGTQQYEILASDVIRKSIGDSALGSMNFTYVHIDLGDDADKIDPNSVWFLQLDGQFHKVTAIRDSKAYIDATSDHGALFGRRMFGEAPFGE